MLSKIWSILSLYIFVPLWIHYVGVEGYGLISFYTILLTLIHFADAGLTATLTREFAREDSQKEYKKDLLRTIEIIYTGIAVIIVVCIFFSSEFIVDAFLKSSSIPHQELVENVQLMSLIVAFNFIYLMYNGGLYGLQKIVLSTAISVSYSVSRGALVVLVLILFPTIKTFFIWQLLSIVVTAVFTRYCLYKEVNCADYSPSCHLDYIKNLWKYSFGMMLMAIIAALNTQSDKLVTGHLLSLESLGFYSLATTLGQAVLFVSQPVAYTFLPELTRLISINDIEKTKKQFLRLSFIVSGLSSILGFFLFFYLKDFALIWTGDLDIVNNIEFPAKVLVLGNIILSFQYMPYFLAMAYGHTKTNVILGVVMFFISIPLIYYCTLKWGINGTPFQFLVLNIIASLVLGIVLINKFLYGLLKKWSYYTLIPFVLSFALFVFFYYVFDFVENSYFRLFVAGIASVLDFILLLIVLLSMEPDLRNHKFVNKLYSIISKKIVLLCC